jgi:hypothetical protein
MGCEYQRIGKQVVDEAISVVGHSNMLFRGALRLILLRNLISVGDFFPLAIQLLTHTRCLAAIPIQFAEERHWGPVTSELPFLALLLGIFGGGAANVL